MVRMFNRKKTMVISVIVFIFSLMQIESFAGQDWELKTQLSTERITFATAVVGNKIYLIGGTLYKDLKPNKAVRGPYGISTVEVYDTQTHTWQRGADMPTPRAGAKAAVVNGTIFVFGGFSAKEDHVAFRKYPVSVEAYNPRTDTWTPKQKMPAPRVLFDICVVDEKVYIIGGATRIDGERIGRVDVYNPATDTWVKGQEMPTSREGLGVGVVSNRIYAIGGRGWPQVRLGPYLTVIEEYNPTSRQWRNKSDMLDTRDSFATVVVRDSIYLIGGIIVGERGFAPEYLASVNVYDPQEDAWSNIPAMPIPFVPGGAAAVNGRIYVFGGIGNVGEGFQLFPDVLVYDTGFHAVEANGKLLKHWGELKAKPEKNPYRD